MTEDRTIHDSYRVALIASAIKRNRYSGFETACWDVKVREAFHLAEGLDLIRGKHEWATFWTYELTEHGQQYLDGKSDMRDGIGMGDISAGDRAMWAWLLQHGGVVSTYGSIPEVTDVDFLHLISCGVDFARSSAVRDDSWTTFAGTFADDDRHTGVGARATCLCDEVENLQVVAEIESVTELLIQLIR